MMNFLRKFRNDESGAISADWVVLTAATVALALAIGISVKTDAVEAGENLGERVATMEF